MRFAALFLSLAVPVFAGEYVVLASGGRLHIDRHEADGDKIRMFALRKPRAPVVMANDMPDSETYFAERAEQDERGDVDAAVEFLSSVGLEMVGGDDAPSEGRDAEGRHAEVTSRSEIDRSDNRQEVGVVEKDDHEQL